MQPVTNTMNRIPFTINEVEITLTVNVNILKQNHIGKLHKINRGSSPWVRDDLIEVYQNNDTN